MQRYTRREKIEYQLSEAKQSGKQSETVSLFPSERKRLQKEGYIVIPAANSNLSIPCKVSWSRGPSIYE